MRRNLILFALLALAMPARLAAQDITGDTFQFNLGQLECAKATTPEGSITAPPGSTCRTSTGAFFVKVTGTGNTGWLQAVVPSTQTANTVFAGPSSGGAALPTFRALVVADLPAGGSNTVLVGTGPAYSGTPTVTSLTATTSVTTPTLTNSGNQTLSPSGDIILNPGGADVLPFANYATNLGSLTNKLLAIHAGELWIQTLVALQTMSTIGGRVFVAPTTVLTADLAAAGTTITVKHNSLANGDRVLMESSGKVEWLAIASTAGGSAGAYTYTVTRNLDGSGANDWYAGDAVANTGTTGNGYIDLYSVAGAIPGSTAGPTIVGNVRTGTTYSNIEPRWAIGNLNGLYGYSGSTYGAAFGVPTGAWVKVDPTNGVRLGFNATTNVQIDASGNASFTGSVTAAAGTIGGWTINSAYLAKDTGTNATSAGMAPTDYPFFAGATYANRATAPFRVTPAGAVNATSGVIGGFTLGATSFTAGSGSTTVGVDSGGTNPAFYAGSATPGSAPFRVTNAGAVTAVSGAIGGFTLGATSITGPTVGLSSAVTGGDDIRIYAGNATPSSAPFTVTESGYLRAQSGTFGSGSNGVDIGTIGLQITGSGQITWRSGNAYMNNTSIYSPAYDFTTGAQLYGSGGDVHSSGDFVADGSVYGDDVHGTQVYVGGDLHFDPPSTNSGDWPVVWSSGNHILYYKDNGSDGSLSCGGGEWIRSLDTQKGFVTGYSCSSLGLPARISALEAEVAALRALLNQLVSDPALRLTVAPIVRKSFGGVH